MKILVTGGAGFIGSHIVDSYLSNGHEVVIVDDLSTGKKEFINNKAKFYKLSIVDKDLKYVFKKEKFDIVNHHAAQMNVRFSVEDPLFDAKTNVLGTLNILENCRKYNVKKVIFASSGGAVYGNKERYPIKEDVERKPNSPYGMSKKTCEDYLFYFNNNHGLNFTSLRYPNVYGPRQNLHGEAGVVAVFMGLLMQNKNVKIYGDGEQIRDYIYVKDVVDANNIVLDKGNNDCFNIGTGIPTTVNHIYKKSKKIIGSKGDGVNVAPKEGDVLKNYLDCEKAKSLLKWQYKVKLDEGLNLTYEWFKN